MFISTGSTAGDAGGRLRHLHQLVPWLRAVDANGAAIALLLHPGHHGRIQRLVTLPSRPLLWFLTLHPDCKRDV